MQETTRAQGWAICGGAGMAALLFLIGIAKQNWWALAIPVAIVTLFALGLVAWVGYTIATIQVEADQTAETAGAAAPKTAGAGRAGATEDAA
ncbi:MAG: hypothetical protein IPK00_03130 [Deltaproteobacteria bacterium]|nr:hypothetical protein [Deltaproteobacteria bacterium]